MNKNGFYIVVEGPVCSGKDTQAELLAKYLLENGLSIEETREPGGTELAERLRDEIFDLRALNTPDEEVLSKFDELWMFYEARALSMLDVVNPALEAGKVVIKKRDYMTTFVNQAVPRLNGSKIVGGSEDEEQVRSWHKKLYKDQGFVEPDLRLMLLLTPEEAISRLKARGAQRDAFDFDENEVRMFVEKYTEIALDIQRCKGPFWKNTIVVDAGYPIEVVAERVKMEVGKRMGLVEEKEGREMRYFSWESRPRRGFESGFH